MIHAQISTRSQNFVSGTSLIEGRCSCAIEAILQQSAKRLGEQGLSQSRVLVDYIGSIRSQLMCMYPSPRPWGSFILSAFARLCAVSSTSFHCSGPSLIGSVARRSPSLEAMSKEDLSVSSISAIVVDQRQVGCSL